MNHRLIDWSFKIVTLGALAILIFLQVSSNTSYVYVDSIKLLNNYEGMIAARKTFELSTSPLKSNLDTLQWELEEKVKEYEEKQDRLSVRERNLYEELIQSKESQYLNFQKAISEKIQKQDQELTQKVLNEVNAFIKQYGEEKGYKIIFAATQQGNIVYAEEEKDITDEVLEGLNKSFRQQ